MEKSIVNREIYNLINPKVNSIKSKVFKSEKSDITPPTVYWYLCAGTDFSRIGQVLDLAELNQLKKPNLFVCTDNHYVLSDNGKVNIGDLQPFTEGMKYLEDQFEYVKSYKDLFGFQFSTKDECSLSRAENELPLSCFFGKLSYEDITKKSLLEKGFNKGEIDLYWEDYHSEEELINRREDADYKEIAELMDSTIHYPDEGAVKERRNKQVGYLNSILNECRQLASLYKHKKKDLYVLLLAVDNMDFIQSNIGQETYAIVGTQNWGHNATEEVNLCGNYSALFKLSVGGSINVNRDDVLIIDTPYEIH